jgi:viroplasmin and RNaseH domain-containing protein
MMPKAQKKKGPKWYGVRRGRQPGIYETWSEAEKQVGPTFLLESWPAADPLQVVGFPGALHASFKTYDEARVSCWPLLKLAALQ